jgi:hypothetical protein
MSENGDSLENQMNLRFPMITISVSFDDVNEPIHVDLGSVPPFVAVSVLEKVLQVMKMLVVGPKVTFQGMVLAEPIIQDEVRFEDFFGLFEDGDDDQSNEK